MDWLPTARRDPRGRVLSWTERTDPKGCLHTTETGGWPGYDGFTVHPHATVRPIAGKGVEIRQNVPFTRASFSLRNLPGGVATNTDYVFQFELIGTCERGEAYRAGAYHWPTADDAVLLALYRELIAPVSKAFRIPVKAPPFQGYPASYGARGKTNLVRLSGPAFDNYSGWLGHEHVPENVHGDPGAFPWARMIELGEDDMSAEDVRAIKDAIPTAQEIAAAMEPVIKAQVDAALTAWQHQVVDLGKFAGTELAKPDGTPAKTQTAGDLLEWAAAHASAAHRIAQQLLDNQTGPDQQLPPTG